MLRLIEAMQNPRLETLKCTETYGTRDPEL